MKTVVASRADANAPSRAVGIAVIVSRSALARILIIGSAVLAVLDSHSLRKQL